MSSDLVLQNGIWTLRPQGEWTKMLLNEADVSRAVKTSDGGVTVVSNITDDGTTNSVQIQNTVATLKSGIGATNNDAAYFGFAARDSGGRQIPLGDSYGVDIYLEWTATPGTNDDNDCFLAHGCNDGNPSWANGKMGGIICWNHASGPKAGIITRGGGQTLGNAYTAAYMLTNMRSVPPGENFIFQSQTVETYDSSDEKVTIRQNNGTSAYNGSSPSRPGGEDFLHIWLAIGTNVAPGSVKNFSFRSYYRVHLLNYKGGPSWRPGS